MYIFKSNESQQRVRLSKTQENCILKTRLHVSFQHNSTNINFPSQSIPSIPIPFPSIIILLPPPTHPLIFYYNNPQYLPIPSMQTPLKIVIFRNKYDHETLQICRDIIITVRHIVPNLTLYSQDCQNQYGINNLFNPSETYDYLIVVGGDGTMTYTVSKFKNKSPPPIFGIGKGNSYIHYNYRIKELKVVLPQFLEKAVKGTVLVDQAIRLRLRKFQPKSEEVEFEELSMSEILVHRGKNPSSLRMEIFINGILLTTFFGDGMIFSTPMGSLGYSLSSSGPILNYETSSIIISPICPLSLSFRPICIPDSSEIKIRLLDKTRSSGVISCDGKKQIEFTRGEELIIDKSQFGAEIVTALDNSKEEVWISKLKTVLKWGNEFCS